MHIPFENIFSLQSILICILICISQPGFFAKQSTKFSLIAWRKAYSPDIIETWLSHLILGVFFMMGHIIDFDSFKLTINYRKAWVCNNWAPPKKIGPTVLAIQFEHWIQSIAQSSFFILVQQLRLLQIPCSTKNFPSLNLMFCRPNKTDSVWWFLDVHV